MTRRNSAVGVFCPLRSSSRKVAKLSKAFLRVSLSFFLRSLAHLVLDHEGELHQHGLAAGLAAVGDGKLLHRLQDFQGPGRVPFLDAHAQGQPHQAPAQGGVGGQLLVAAVADLLHDRIGDLLDLGQMAGGELRSRRCRTAPAASSAPGWTGPAPAGSACPAPRSASSLYCPLWMPASSGSTSFSTSAYSLLR